MSPTPRAAALLALAAACAIAAPSVAVALALALAGATLADALSVRRPPRFARKLPAVVSRGIPAALEANAVRPGAAVRLRQVSVPDVAIEPREGDRTLAATLTAGRRGRHRLPPLAARSVGPLGLAAWHHTDSVEAELRVYPDMPAARRLALAVRHGRFRDQGLMTRGPLGLGTEFEAVRDYEPDDDIRQVNWRATARAGRPMSNQFRIEQDRDVVCMIDAGRLMTAPLATRTRLDAAVDAATAVALVADELGDRCGAVAFDAEIRRRLRPRRAGAAALVEAIFDLEPRTLDSDYELAFRTVAGTKRALVVVLTDLLDEAAARSLVEAVPVLARRHSVLVASISDPDVEEVLARRPESPLDVYEAAAALDVVAERRRAAAALRGAGAELVEAPPDALSAACVRAYLGAKARARL